LGYQAIPSLLATLLHQQTITIQLEDREQKITWRKVQDGGSSKIGLHLVSYPFKANYIEKNDDDGSEKEIEMLPFFVRNDLQTEELIKALCRVPHYLRTSPAFTKGNISHPHPMHIGNNLIEDMLCILDLDC
jgi:hypothetical protein